MDGKALDDVYIIYAVESQNIYTGVDCITLGEIMTQVTLDMVYDELKSIRKELTMVEYAVIPVERLSSQELEAHKRDLKEALKSERVNFRNLKR